MVEKRIENPKKVLETYKKRLEEKIRVDRMILFGSYSRGNPHDYSDLDVAIISPDFRGSLRKNFLLLDRVAREVSPLIEAFPYTPEDLKNRQPGDFIDEILKTGQVV